MLKFEKQQQNTSTPTQPVDASKKELAKQSFKPIDAQELQDPENISAIWVKELNSILSKINIMIHKSLMTDMKPKDAIKLDIIKLD